LLIHIIFLVLMNSSPDLSNHGNLRKLSCHCASDIFNASNLGGTVIFTNLL